MSLWRRISASTNLSPEGEQYVVVYAGNTQTTDNDLNLIAYPFDSVNGFGDRLLPSEFIVDGFDGSGRVKFSPINGRIATTAPIQVNGDFGLASYNWDEGFGTRTSSGVKPRGGQVVDFHPDGDIAFVSHAENSSTSKLYAYNWSDATGYGSTRSSSSNISNAPQDWMPIAVSPNGQFVALGYSYSLKLAIFPFSRTTGFGTVVEPSVNPISVNPGNVRGVAFNNAGTYVALTNLTTDPTQRLHIWAWDNATGTLGAKVANVVIEPSITTSYVGGYAVEFAPDDSAIILGVNVAGRQLQAYAWDNDTGTFGSQYSLPSTSGGTPQEIAFNTNGNVIFAGGGQSSNTPVVAYQWDSETGFGVKYDNPDTTGLGVGYGAFSIDYKDFG